MHRNTSPFIDEVAAQGIVFDNAMAHSSYTRESISALFTGLLPSSGGSIGYTAKPSARVSNLAELYEEAGYRTGLFSATTALNGPEFKKGFDETDFLAKQWDTSGLSRPLSDRALAFVDGAGDQKFMMYLHYFDPHGPYDPPEELYRRFSKKAVEKRLTLYHHARPLLPQLVEQGFGPGEERFEDLLLRYDAEIADVDRAVESLFQGLEDRGKLDNTLVVFTADHGEEFLDHGFRRAPLDSL